MLPEEESGGAGGEPREAEDLSDGVQPRAGPEPSGTGHLQEAGGPRSRRVQHVLYALMAVCAVGAVATAMWNLSRGDPGGADRPRPAEGLAADGGPADLPGRGSPAPLPEAAGGEEADSGASDRAPPAAGEEKSAQQARSDYLALARLFEEELDPALEAVSLAEWDPDSARNIREGRERALREFTAGSYMAAVELLVAADALAREMLEIGEARFRRHLEQAADSLEALDPALAGRHIDQALGIKPGDAEAQALRGRIEVLPEVLKAMEDASRARAQNDARAELAALERVLRLDPLRVEAEGRFRQLAAEVAERVFGEAIVEGLRAARENDLPAAERALQQVRKLGPARDETALLAAEVGRLQREAEIARLLAEAESRAVGDDWSRAHDAFRKVLELDPSSAAALNGAELAGRMVRAGRQVAGYLERPDRLSSDNVAAAARAALEDARLLSRLGSERLARQAERLEAALREASIEIEVLVRSDNLTEILVRRVGQVGRVTEKVISLRPGTYVFEGRREGYRSKLVELAVVAGATAPVEVTVVCDERI